MSLFMREAASTDRPWRDSPSRDETSQPEKVVQPLQPPTCPLNNHPKPAKIKTVKVVVRGIDMSTEPELVMEWFSDLGFYVSQSQRFKSKRGRRPPPLYVIDVENNEKFKKIFNITKLDCHNVKVSPFKYRRIVQCFRCERFGHFSYDCTSESRCLHCAGSHRAAVCRKRNTKPKCANCSGEHMASFHGCPQHPKNIRKKLKRLLPAPEKPAKPTKTRQELLELLKNQKFLATFALALNLLIHQGGFLSADQEELLLDATRGQLEKAEPSSTTKKDQD